MKTRFRRSAFRRAFTLIELLVVIAIIAILAAILFPVFGTVREQARQSNTLSNLHAVSLGARLFYEDEGRFPATLFPYAETSYSQLQADNTTVTKNRPALGDIGCAPNTSCTSEKFIVPMDQATGQYKTGASTINRGFLYREQVKDLVTFQNADAPAADPNAVTPVYYPRSAPYGGGPSLRLVLWEDTAPPIPGVCTLYGDSNIPNGILPNGANDPNYPPTYVGRPKLFYKADSMDIGPMLNADGTVARDIATGVILYELHYSPDWTHELGAACDKDGNGKPYVTQLKYKNPPTERTIITYVTHHAAQAGSSSVIVLLLSGTARKINAVDAYKPGSPVYLPLEYGSR